MICKRTSNWSSLYEFEKKTIKLDIYKNKYHYMVENIKTGQLSQPLRLCLCLCRGHQYNTSQDEIKIKVQ